MVGVMQRILLTLSKLYSQASSALFAAKNELGIAKTEKSCSVRGPWEQYCVGKPGFLFSSGVYYKHIEISLSLFFFKFKDVFILLIILYQYERMIKNKLII